MPPVTTIKTKPQHQETPPASTTPPPAPPKLRVCADFPEFAAAKSKLDAMTAELDAVRVKTNQLQAELGWTGPADEVQLEAMELAGQAGPGATADAIDKHSQYKVLARHGQVLDRAIKLHAPVVEDEHRKAWGAVMREALPEVNALLARHAEAVVTAARSLRPVTRLMDSILAGSPASAVGFGNHMFLPLDMADQNSLVSLFLSELIGIGVLTGRETWLSADVPLVARGPDGTTAVDRPVSPGNYGPWSVEPPPPAPSFGQSLLGAMGNAARRGASAVVSAFSPGNPGRDALPPTPAVVSSSHAPAVKGPTRTIRLLRGMATAANEWPAGSTVPWEAADAGRMVAAGVAVWADGVPRPRRSR